VTRELSHDVDRDIKTGNCNRLNLRPYKQGINSLKNLASIVLGFIVLFPTLGGAQQNPVPIGRFEMAYPYPSPDNSQLIFQGDFDGRWQLYIIDLESGSIQRAHVSQQDDTHPAWSPDGEKIAFISNRDGNDEVYVLNLESGSVYSVTPHPGKDGHPKWSADGQWLVFNRTFDPSDKEGDSDSAIMRVRFDGTKLSVVSDTPNIETFASFSPDRTEVTFVEWIAEEGKRPSGDIVVVDVKTGVRRNLTQSSSFDGYPFWGARGDWIYFSTFEALEKGGYEAVLYRVDPSGEHLEPLSDINGRHERRTITSIDEKSIFYNSTIDGQTLIFRSDLPEGRN